MNTLNRLLRPTGWMLAPRPPSAKMLREHANTSEAFHPSRGGRTVAWMRHLADLLDPAPSPVSAPAPGTEGEETT